MSLPRSTLHNRSTNSRPPRPWWISIASRTTSIAWRRIVLHGLALRPHVKTHKSPRIAAEQLRLGAAGLTCATPRELEVMSDTCDDLLLAHPPVGAAKLRRVLAINPDVRLTVAIDSVEAVEAMAEVADAVGREVDVYVEVDVGMRRVGVATPDEAIAIARRVNALPPLRFHGITFYPGHVRQHLSQQDGGAGEAARRPGELAPGVRRCGPPALRGQRRIDAGGMAHARGGRCDRGPAGHLRLQRPRDRGGRCLRLGRLRAHRAGDGDQHRRRRPGRGRRGEQER